MCSGNMDVDYGLGVAWQVCGLGMWNVLIASIIASLQGDFTFGILFCP